MDTVELVLPISNKKVELRGYTTHKDDSIAENILYANVKSDTDGKVEFPIANIMAMNEVYLRRLVISIDADTNRSSIEQAIDDMHSEDYEAIDTAVTKIVESSSPKAREVVNASKNTTTKK